MRTPRRPEPHGAVFESACPWLPCHSGVVGSNPNYVVPFVCASLAYLFALGAIHLLAPRLAPAIVDR